ncbi:MAG: helix-turn-helix domain-containing protein [Bacillota bacterium]
MEIKLIDIIKKQNMNLEQLSKIMNVSKSTLYNFSSNGVGSMELILKLSYVLDYPVTDIVDLEDNEKQELEDRLWRETDDIK